MKKYVCTITPNPALDLGGTVDNLKPNEKSYVYDETRSAGGNAVNVARILTRLSVPTSATGFLGGSVGEEIQFLLDNENVTTDFVKIKGHSRINVTVSNRSDHRQTRFTFPGPSITESEKESLFKLIYKSKGISLLVFGGSLPKGFTSTDARHLIASARSRNINVVLDCPAGTLRPLIAARPFLIKPNLDEFQKVFKTKAKTIASVRREAEKLLNRIPYVCVSSVEGGTLLVTKHGTFFGRIPKIRIQSTVGAGDSMVGAMVAQLHQKNFSGKELLAWGLAASAATLAQPGTSLGSGREIRHLYKKIKVMVAKI